MQKIIGIVCCTLLLAAPVWAAERFSPVHTTIAVATTTTVAAPKNENRNLLILENISDTDIDCSIGSAAVVGQGVRILKNGGSLLLDIRFPVFAVNCIQAGSGTKTLLVTEGVQ